MVVATAPRNGKSATTSDETITIQPLHIQRIVIPIKGTQPLITNKFSDEAAEKLAGSQTGPQIKAAKTPRLPEAEFLAARYVLSADPSGAQDLDICGFPAAGLKKAMVAAAMRVTEAKGTWVRAILNVEGENGTGLVAIEAGPPKQQTDHVVQAGRGNLRYRPVFWPWSMNVAVTFNTDQIKAQDVVNLVQQAGFSIGIGDWRPEKNGQYGTFEVDSVALDIGR
jgi:hypothetical protein